VARGPFVLRPPLVTRIGLAIGGLALGVAGALTLSAFPRPLLTFAGLAFLSYSAILLWITARARVTIDAQSVQVRVVRTTVVPLDQAQTFLEGRGKRGTRRHSVLLKRSDGPPLAVPVTPATIFADTEANATRLVDPLNAALRAAKSG